MAVLGSNSTRTAPAKAQPIQKAAARRVERYPGPHADYSESTPAGKQYGQNRNFGPKPDLTTRPVRRLPLTQQQYKTKTETERQKPGWHGESNRYAAPYFRSTGGTAAPPESPRINRRLPQAT